MKPTRRSVLLGGLLAPLVPLGFPWLSLSDEPPNPRPGVEESKRPHWVRAAIATPRKSSHVQLDDSIQLGAGDFLLIARTAEVIPVAWVNGTVLALDSPTVQGIEEHDWICRLYKRGNA